MAAPLAGALQGVHDDVPHEFTLVLSAHRPLQSCLPASQVPLHEVAIGMQDPAHSFCPLGHWPPHWVPSHVELPPVGGVHGVQDPPQLAGSVLETQAPPHR